MLLTTEFLCVVLSFILILYLTRKRDKKGPPGPIAYPVIGNLFQIGAQMEVVFKSWSKFYGKIFSVKLGLENFVIIDDYKMIREAMEMPEFAGRPDNKFLAVTSGGPIGVLFSQGELWEQQRRFTLRYLRDFGFGKSSMETLILDEVKELLENWENQIGKPLAVENDLSIAVVNSLLHISCGKRFSQNDPKLREMTRKMGEMLIVIGRSPLMFIPWLGQVAPELSGYNKFMSLTEEWQTLFIKTVDDHIKAFDKNNNTLSDFIDRYLMEIHNTTDPVSSFYGINGFGRTNLVAVIGDIFVAGTETSSNILNWSMLFLSAHPKIQEKVQEEIDRVVGHSRLPSLSDKSKMPFVEATIMEIHRYGSIIPFSAPHSTMVDVKFHGFEIPKNTWVLPNLYSVHHSLEIWGDPENFRPERFLRPDGRGVVKHAAFMPFGFGKRQCLGESLARDTHFLFLVSIFQRFSVFPDPIICNPNFEVEAAFLRKPKPFRVIFQNRL